ncbi:methyltransferase, FxLD system [Streptomyces sp. NBC_01304]|uniref:methyltransferase, FxLD system n=1 Tax=Streptomyces sp. NBC_01304 TaxID=2903818 RepID=UPI002E14D4C2|nr:methyltransferase, FxLD system [Streptomyces sp. NBC_01304]
MTPPRERPTVTTSATTELDETGVLRHQLANRLLAEGHIRTTAVENAFRTVPRHSFAPEVPTEKAYANDIIPTRHNDDGRVISSVSAPWLQADMLEAARVQPGHHVLEIGSGGYNAALLAQLVGPTGSVTTLDIDPAVTDRADQLLTEAGYDTVRVVTADAEHLPAEVVPNGGFNAIVVTVDTWDLPWIHMVTEGGRLIAPLRLHQYVWSIGFTKRDGALVSDEPLTVCGFVPMQGEGAWDTRRRTVPGRGIHLAFEDGSPLPVDRLTSAFDTAPATVHTHVTVGGQEPFADLALYLAGALPGFCRLSVDPDSENGVLNPPPRHWPGAAIVRGASLARLDTERISDGDDGNGVYELVVHGYGPAGQLAAEEMGEQVRHWQRNHRAALCPRITVRPVTGSDSVAEAHAPHVFRKKHTQVTIDWPVIPGTAALLTDDDGRYLLHLRSANKPIWRAGHWALLGGNTERGETCDEGIVRELDEEIGLAIPDLTGFVTLDTLDADGSLNNRVRVYHGTLNRPVHEIELHEGIQLRWTRLEEAAEMTMDPGAAAVLQAHQDTSRPAPSSDGTLPTVQVREPRDPLSRSIIDVYVLLRRADGRILLMERANTGYADGQFCPPSGHREHGESVVADALREVYEEVGVEVDEDALAFVHVVHHRNGDEEPRIGFFFLAESWRGEPVNREPHKCAQLLWADPTSPPANTVPYTAAALAQIANQQPFSLDGWGQSGQSPAGA